MLGAPLSVPLTLLFLHNVLAVLAVYHITFCLLLPLLYNLVVRRISLRNHLRQLGLTRRTTLRGFLWGVSLAILLGGGTLLSFHLLGDTFLRDNAVAQVLVDWGVTSTNLSWLFWFMVLINGPAEELFWRGFIHTRLQSMPNRRLALILPSACYASYHGVTVFLFLSSVWVAGFFLLNIFAVGLFWAWLRERTDSVWPSLISHGAASAAYMIVAMPLLDQISG